LSNRNSHTQNILPEDDDSTGSTHGQHGCEHACQIDASATLCRESSEIRNSTIPAERKMYSDIVTNGHHKLPSILLILEESEAHLDISSINL